MGSAGMLKSHRRGRHLDGQGRRCLQSAYPQPAGQFPQYQAISKVAVDPRNSNTVIAGTKTGLYFSYNGGDTWTGPCLPDAFTDPAPGRHRPDVLDQHARAPTLMLAIGTRGYSTTVSTLAENGANGIYKTTVPAAGCPATWTLISAPRQRLARRHRLAASRIPDRRQPPGPHRPGHGPQQPQLHLRPGAAACQSDGDRSAAGSSASGAPPTAAPPGSSAPTATAPRRGCLRLRLPAELVRPGHRGRPEQPEHALHGHLSTSGSPPTAAPPSTT